MTDQKSHKYETVGEILDGYLNYVSEFIEKIGDEDPIPFYSETAAKMRIIQRKINQIKPPFLKKRDVQELSDSILTILIHWNKNIEKNVLNYVSVYNEIARNSFAKKDNYNPMKSIVNGRERFLNANVVFEKVLKNINKKKMLEETDLYALFFALISSQEVMEKILHGEISNSIKRYNIENYDLTEIFSVTGKWKDTNGIFKTDSKVIRNALSHFDFKLVQDQGLIIFNPTSQDVETRKTFTLREFFKYVSDNRFLLQTFYVALCVLVSFTLLRTHYVIDDTS